MFSSNPNVFFPPFPLFDHEKDRIFFNNHQNNSDPFLSGDCTLPPPPPPFPATPNITPINQDSFSCSQQQPPFFERINDDLLDAVVVSSKKTKRVVESKKEGRSKIYTAGGFRDRRVRLSVDISRKFFSLQDLLGFDKASKTLDWLLGKCKNAIEELIEETNHCPNCSTTNYDSKTSFLEAINEEKSKKKKVPREQHSRAVARARARERVKEKMRIRDDELMKSTDFDYDQNFKSSAGENHLIISAHTGAW